MSVLDKIRSINKRFCVPTKFIVKMVLGVFMPGGGSVIDFI